MLHLYHPIEKHTEFFRKLLQPELKQYLSKYIFEQISFVLKGKEKRKEDLIEENRLKREKIEQKRKEKEEVMRKNQSEVLSKFNENTK